MYVLENKNSENILKLFINEKTDINQRNYEGKKISFNYFLENYSEVNIRKFFYFFQNCKMNFDDILNFEIEDSLYLNPS